MFVLFCFCNSPTLKLHPTESSLGIEGGEVGERQKERERERCYQPWDRSTAWGPPGHVVSFATSISVRRAHSIWKQLPLEAPANEVWVHVCKHPLPHSWQWPTDPSYPESESGSLIQNYPQQYAMAPKRTGVSSIQELLCSPNSYTFTSHHRNDRSSFQTTPAGGGQLSREKASIATQGSREKSLKPTLTIL